MPMPQKIEPQSLNDYLEVMSRAAFQAGISWQVVDKKWPGIKEAFRGFDVHAVAGFGDNEIDTLAGDARVIRNRRKLQAIVTNARQLLMLDADYGGFLSYLRSHGGFDATAKDLRKQFKFLGEHGAYYFLYVVNEKVPPHEEWAASRGVKV